MQLMATLSVSWGPGIGGYKSYTFLEQNHAIGVYGFYAIVGYVTMMATKS